MEILIIHIQRLTTTKFLIMLDSSLLTRTLFLDAKRKQEKTEKVKIEKKENIKKKKRKKQKERNESHNSSNYIHKTD